MNVLEMVDALRKCHPEAICYSGKEAYNDNDTIDEVKIIGDMVVILSKSERREDGK